MCRLQVCSLSFKLEQWLEIRILVFDDSDGLGQLHDDLAEYVGKRLRWIRRSAPFVPSVHGLRLIEDQIFQQCASFSDTLLQVSKLVQCRQPAVDDANQVAFVDAQNENQPV